ncbi:MAG: Gp19/Gp15/Gp42 family protein [Actinomyces sp.]|nr:Gp19/Gp15/Gp42 family protein [Actinomyces sp.]
MAPAADPLDVTITAFRNRYGPYEESQVGQQVVDVALPRAARIVRDELAADGIDLSAALADGTIRRDSYEDVVCDMVRYAIRQQADGFAYGATQSTVTGGPYSQSSTFTAPVGSMSFTRVHRRRLGIRLRRFASVRTIGARS